MMAFIQYNEYFLVTALEIYTQPCQCMHTFTHTYNTDTKKVNKASRHHMHIHNIHPHPLYTHTHTHIHTHTHTHTQILLQLLAVMRTWQSQDACALSRHCEPCKQSSWNRARNSQENKPFLTASGVGTLSPTWIIAVS